MDAERRPQGDVPGPSVWLEGLGRGLLPAGGTVTQLIEEAGLRGVLADAVRYERAIGATADDREAIRGLARQGWSAEEIWESLTGEDGQRAADLLRPVYDRTDADDGFVCLPLAPTLADDAKATVAGARRLWARLRRPNLMVTIPATVEGLLALEQLVSEGIHVHATLLFSVPRYEQVAEAYAVGLQRRLARGAPVTRVASIAGFCLRPLDDLIDQQLERVIRRDGPKAELARQLQGRIARATACVACQSYQALTAGPRWQRLARHGARPPRLLWADLGRGSLAEGRSSATDALGAPGTIRALALETLQAWQAGGSPTARWDGDVTAADKCLRQLREVRIDLTNTTRQLEDLGLRGLQLCHHKLLARIEDLRRTAVEVTRSGCEIMPKR
jgi:transaldolase